METKTRVNWFENASIGLVAALFWGWLAWATGWSWWPWIALAAFVFALLFPLLFDRSLDRMADELERSINHD